MFKAATSLRSDQQVDPVSSLTPFSSSAHLFPGGDGRSVIELQVTRRVGRQERQFGMECVT